MPILNVVDCFNQEGVDREKFNVSLDNIDFLVWKTVEQLRDIVTRDAMKGIYIGHSGGKDSCAIYWLMKMAFPLDHIPVVHTTKPKGEGATHPLTLKFLYEQPFPITYCPRDAHDRLGFKTQVDGSRRDEYTRTDGRSTNIVMNGKDVSREHMTMFVANGLFGLDFVYPIVEWSNEDVWALLYMQRISVSEEYLGKE
jgi:3'-phosphoadenosine 5'-phosphosulfate sulfotransferase (PAPS reductase)/FAD synthetase